MSIPKSRLRFCLLDLRDLCAEGKQTLDELTVTTLHSLERRDACLTFSGETGCNQRHARAQIAAIQHTATAQFRWTSDDDAVRVGEEHVGTHAAHLLEREETQLVHPVVHKRSACCLCREHCDEADQVAWKRRP